MTSKDAIDFLKPAENIIKSSGIGQWVDLGCGSGLFTNAQATLLDPGSHIYAIDQQNNLKADERKGSAAVEFIQADFINDEISIPLLNGILMANSLHYVKDKIAFIKKWKSKLSKNGCWIIIEYDTEKANSWVPYPISFNELQKLFELAGYTQINKTAERKSIYNSGKMYCATIWSAYIES